MRKPHLLYLAFFYPPSRASGVFRAVATSQAFVDAGWDVTVVTTTQRFFDEEIGSTDESLLDLIPAEVEVVRVPFSFHGPQSPSKIREMGRFQGNFPLVARYLRNRTRGFRSAMDIILGRSPHSFPMDDRYLTWIEPVVRAARQVNQKSPLSHILATGNPYSAFEAARLIGRVTGTPFSVDYRDPWTFDLRTGGPAKLTAATYAAEATIVEEAASCIHVNQPIAEAYAEQYPDSASKQHVVLNGYDQLSIAAPRKPYSGGPLQLGMLGTVTDLWPLDPLFMAWSRVQPMLPEGSILRLAGHLGYFAWSDEGLLDTLPDATMAFRYEGPVEKAKVADFYASLDIVVVPLFGGPMVTSGKIFEAAGLGIPVVCIQAEDGGARAILQDHPFGFGVEVDAEAIEKALLQAAEVAMTFSADDVMDARAKMSVFERQTSLKHMVEIIGSATTAVK